jgi:hypothetical protein
MCSALDDRFVSDRRELDAILDSWHWAGSPGAAVSRPAARPGRPGTTN